jgi:hypothetical protein
MKGNAKMTTNTCPDCGRGFSKGEETIYHCPPIFEVQLGIDRAASYHTKCYALSHPEPGAEPNIRKALKEWPGATLVSDSNAAWRPLR